MTSEILSAEEPEFNETPSPPRKSQNRSPAIQMFLWTLKKNALICGICSLLCLLVSPGIMITKYFNDIGYNSSIPESLEYINYVTTEYFNTAVIALVVIIGILILLLCSINFSYMHSKKATDMFEALPISRAKLLLSKFFATAVLVIIPMLLSFAASWVTLAITPLEGYSLLEHLSIFIILSISALVCLAFTTLIFVATGNTFDAIVAILVTNIGWPIIWNVVITICDSSLTGFPYEADSTYALIFSPFGRLFTSVSEIFEYHSSGTTVSADFLGTILWLIFGIVILGFSIFLYRIRKSEAAQSPYAFKFLPICLQVIVCAIAGYILALMFSMGESNTPVFYIFYGIGAIIGAIVFGAISYRGFKKIKRDVIVAVCVSLVAVSFYGIISSGGLGYETRIPAVNSVKSVELSFGSTNFNNYNYNYNYYMDLPNTAVLTSKEDIEKVNIIHNAVIEYIKSSNTELDDIYLGSSGFRASSPYYDGYITLDYKLTNGLTLSREYQINGDNFDSLIAPMLSSEGYISQTESAYKYDDYSAFAYMDIYDSNNNKKFYPDKYLSSDDTKELIEAYKLDRRNISADNFVNGHTLTVNLFTSSNRTGLPGEEYIQMSVLSSFKNTIQKLEEFKISADSIYQQPSSLDNIYPPLSTVGVNRSYFSWMRDYNGTTNQELLQYVYTHEIPVCRTTRQKLLPADLMCSSDIDTALDNNHAFLILGLTGEDQFAYTKDNDYYSLANYALSLEEYNQLLKDMETYKNKYTR